MTTTTLSARAAVLWRPALAVAGPVGGLGAYLGLLAVRLPGIVVQLGHDSDAVSPMVVATTLATGHGRGEVHLGNFPNYATVLVDVATANLGGHRALWTVLPFLVALATVGVLALAVLRVAGGWAAAVAVVLAAAASPALLEAYATQAYRGSTLVATAVAGWFVVWLTREPRSTRRTVAVGAPVAVVTAACLVSDPLMLVSAVAPLAVVGVLLLRPWAAPPARRTAEGVTLLAIVAATATAALVASRVARRHGFATSPGATSALPVGGPHHWPQNARLLGESLVHLAQGTTIAEGVSATMLVAGGALLATGATVAMLAALGSLRGTVARSAPAVGACEAHLAYWTVSAAAVCAAFVGGSAPTDVKSVRYLVALPLAVAAVVPVWAAQMRGRRGAVAAGATMFALLAVVQLQRSVDRDAFALQPYAAGQVRLAGALEAAGLHQGYAPYFDASALTWTTDGAITVRPVVAGTHDCPRAVCPVQVYSVDSWYDGTHGGPTFVVLDPLDAEVRGVVGAVGPPTTVLSVGRFFVLVYPDDVARHFGRIPAGG